MSPELLVGLVAVLTLAAIQAVYIARGEPTISERIRALFRLYPPTGFLVGIVAGLFLGHWFWCP